MEILQYTSDMQAPLTQFYNRLTADVPHCYSVKEEELVTAIRGVTTGKSDKNEGGIDAETAFVAVMNGAVQAFIHVGIGQVWDHEEKKADAGVIRFFWL